MRDAGRDRLITIGQRIRPYGWAERTTGTARYVADVDLGVPVLAGKILRSPHPHAQLLDIDTRAAERLEGVRGVITAADLPDVTFIHLGGEYRDRRPLAVDRVRYVGEEVAAVAADSEVIAERALSLINVRYRRRPAPLTMDAALRKGAPRLHDRLTGRTNVSVHLRDHWGDLGAEGDTEVVRAAGTFTYPRISHANMEPNSTLARWDLSRELLEIWTTTQAPYFVELEVANVLGLEPQQVVCREVAVGGGFGSRSRVCEQEAIAAALARRTGQPVRIVLTREEEFATTKTRHATRVTLETTATRQGRLHSIAANLDMDNGAYNHQGPSVLKVAIKKLGSIYTPKLLKWDARLIDTALPPGGSFRGYGGPQVVFGLESLVDEVARQLGMDPLEFRLRNANKPGTTTLSGGRLGSARLKECLLAVREAIDWDAKRKDRHPRRGVGVAVGIHGSGSFGHPLANRSEAAVDLSPDGRAHVRFGGSDTGTGQRSVLAMICAEELSLDPGDVTVQTMDGQDTPFDLGAWSSRGTHMGGHAVRQAASDLRDMVLDLGRKKLATADVRMSAGRVVSSNDSIAIGDLVSLSPSAADGVLTAHAEYVDPWMEEPTPDNKTPNMHPSYTFAAHAAEVEFDPATGELHVIDYVAAHDIGTAIHPTQAEGQIIGGVAMGMGAVLGEELLFEGGRPVNPSYQNYALPRAADLPAIKPILIEGGDPAGPYGAKSVGEMSLVPVAPAVGNALFHAAGIRLYDLPLTPDKLLAALAGGTGRPARRSNIWRRPNRWWISGMRYLYPRGVKSLLEKTGRIHRPSKDPPPVEEIVEPSSAEDATKQLVDGSVAIAGGTDVLLQRRQRLVHPAKLVSLSDIEGMDRVFHDGSGWEFGANVTLAELWEVACEHHMDGLADAVTTIASPQIRRVATIAGNLLQAKRCWFFRNEFPCFKRSGTAAPCYAIEGDHRFYHAAVDAHRCQAVTPSDLATILFAYDAEVTIVGPSGKRMQDIGSFFRGPGEANLRQGELVWSVRLPGRASGKPSTFDKLRLWEGDFAILSVALAGNIDEYRRWRDLRIVLGSMAPTPWRAEATESSLEGTQADARALRSRLDEELYEEGHPLPGNAWKLQAAPGLAERSAARLLAVTHSGWGRTDNHDR